MKQSTNEFKVSYNNKNYRTFKTEKQAYNFSVKNNGTMYQLVNNEYIPFKTAETETAEQTETTAETTTTTEKQDTKKTSRKTSKKQHTDSKKATETTTTVTGSDNKQSTEKQTVKTVFKIKYNRDNKRTAKNIKQTTNNRIKLLKYIEQQKQTETILNSYTVLKTNTETAETETTVINAINLKQAYTTATAETDSKTSVRIYNNIIDNKVINSVGILLASIHIAKKTAENSVNRTGGNSTQNTILNDLKIIEYLVNKEYRTAETNKRLIDILHTAYINDIIKEYATADTSDFLSICRLALIQATADNIAINTAYHDSFLKLNEYVMKQRTATEYETSMEFIAETTGELIAINKHVAKILNNGDRYTPIVNSDLTTKQVQNLSFILSCIADNLTDRQKNILKLRLKNLSYDTICKQLNIKSKNTITYHIQKIRETGLNLIKNNAIDLMFLVKQIEIEQEQKQKQQKQAETQKEYRQRKKEQQKQAEQQQRQKLTALKSYNEKQAEQKNK